MFLIPQLFLLDSSGKQELSVPRSNDLSCDIYIHFKALNSYCVNNCLIFIS